MDYRKAVGQLREIERLVREFGEEPRLAAEGGDEGWKTLVAIMLSAQTRDSKTVVVCEKSEIRKRVRVGSFQNGQHIQTFGFF